MAKSIREKQYPDLKDAMQIGSTRDMRAGWLLEGKTFIVVHDAKQRPCVIDVKPEEVVRRCDPPIPWVELA